MSRNELQKKKEYMTKRIITWTVVRAYWTAAGFLACRVSGYIILVQYKDFRHDYNTLKTQCSYVLQYTFFRKLYF